MTNLDDNPAGRDPTRPRIALINGPNMTNLGRRDPHIYGTIGSLAELEDAVSETGRNLGVEMKAFHSNTEGELVDFVENDRGYDAYLINPGGLWAFGEPTRIALEQTGKPVVEVHFANIYATGHRSIYTKSVAGTVMGFRQHGYIGAVAALAAKIRADAGTVERGS